MYVGYCVYFLSEIKQNVFYAFSGIRTTEFLIVYLWILEKI